MHPSIDQEKTQKYGINAYRSKLYINIVTKGRRDNTTRIATEEDKILFVEAWQRFEQKEMDSGIPLRSLPGWSTENEKALNDLGVKSVEDLMVYDGTLPWHELRVMKDAAIYLHHHLLEYSPPDYKPEHDHVREQIPVHRTMDAPKNRGSLRDHTYEQNSLNRTTPERIGVWLDEEGNIAKTEGGQEEGIQETRIQEKSVQKAPLKLVF